MATRRKSTDITRAELISMVARLRGALYGVLAGESDRDEIRSLLDQTAFDCDGDSFDHPEHEGVIRQWFDSGMEGEPELPLRRGE